MAGVFFVFYGWIVFEARRPNLPNPGCPLKFYSNQSRQDIKQVFLQALNDAHQSIFLSVYGITDPQILDAVRKKSAEHLPIFIEYDPTASSALKKHLPSSIHLKPVKSKGLMHRKIVLIDRGVAYLGSANLTPSSLRHHANLVVGLYHPGLAEFLENPAAKSYFFELQGQKGEVYLLPDPQKAGLSRLIESIDKAERQIHIAMFTLTHPGIVEALARARKRKVTIRIALDAYTARGASKKSLEVLDRQGVSFYLSQGRELLHHKWALIDEETLAMGSANWTKAAFDKNDDFLLFLAPLDKIQKRFLKNLWEIVESESIEYKATLL